MKKLILLGMFTVLLATAIISVENYEEPDPVLPGDTRVFLLSSETNNSRDIQTWQVYINRSYVKETIERQYRLELWPCPVINRSCQSFYAQRVLDNRTIKKEVAYKLIPTEEKRLRVNGKVFYDRELGIACFVGTDLRCDSTIDGNGDTNIDAGESYVKTIEGNIFYGGYKGRLLAGRLRELGII